MKILIIILLSFASSVSCLCQSNVRFSIMLTDQNFKDVAQSHFKIKVVNVGFDRYWVQDTSYLASKVESPFSSFIYPIIWRKIGGKYQLYEAFKNRFHSLPSKCLDSCCNCQIISKGDSLTFTLELLKCCHWENGEYKLQAYLRAPPSVCDTCGQIIELESNYLYFTVKDQK